VIGHVVRHLHRKLGIPAQALLLHADGDAIAAVQVKDAARIVPVGVPPSGDAMEIGKAAVEISAETGRQIRIVGSTDLTHYGPNYGFSPKGTGAAAVAWVKKDNDRRIIDALLALDPQKVIEEALTRQNACCAGAAAGAVAAGNALGSEKAELVAYATSYDKHPDDSLVGYAGLVF
jgi:AmmeMemoRadiSam system protein B